ncbi:RNA-binding protein Musashi-like Rbp6 [Papilio xuthus]|uniref:RNA-binding protein Musashi-like Rbp6 n=1 Tax=Papilio xuthus TaxID=66420 RepID=A0A194Q8A6_PAPXU|nr:RNA-binding protein Musashi-like Rbp6 [Papilio xuthus]
MERAPEARDVAEYFIIRDLLSARFVSLPTSQLPFNGNEGKACDAVSISAERFPDKLISPLSPTLSLAVCVYLTYVECKKAQPKEVMLPANLAKTRAAGRGAYGELLGSALAAGGGAGVRYAPYPVHAPQLLVSGAGVGVGASAHVAHAAYRRALAALRPAPRPPRPTLAPLTIPPLAYSVSDLLGAHALDIPTLYSPLTHATLPTPLPL